MRKIGWIFVILCLTACDQQTSSAPAPSPQTTAAVQESPPPTPADLETGERVYKQACATCHEEGIAGAPKMGDKEAWKPSLAKGMEEMVRNSINGVQGNRGVMPPKGGVKSLTDAEVAAAVAWMVQQVRQNQ